MNIFFQLALTLFALLVMVGIIGANFKTKVPPLVSQGIGLLIWLDILPWLLWAALGFIIVADNIVQAARQRKRKQQLSTENPAEPGPNAESTKTQQPTKHPASPDAAGI